MSSETFKILVCDDSALARKQLKDIVVEANVADFTFIEGKNGQEAIDLYKEHKPDIAFLDIVMPEKDGVAAVGEIREFDPEAQIIIISSVGTQKQLKDSINAGAKDFLQKPYNQSALIEIIDKHFGGK